MTVRRFEAGDQPVGDHHEHCVGETGRGPPVTELFVVFIETETAKHVVDGGHRPEPRCSIAGQFGSLEPGAVGMVRQGSDDPIQLAGVA